MAQALNQCNRSVGTCPKRDAHLVRDKDVPSVPGISLSHT